MQIWTHFLRLHDSWLCFTRLQADFDRWSFKLISYVKDCLTRSFWVIFKFVANASAMEFGLQSLSAKFTTTQGRRPSLLRCKNYFTSRFHGRGYCSVDTNCTHSGRVCKTAITSLISTQHSFKYNLCTFKFIRARVFLSPLEQNLFPFCLTNKSKTTTLKRLSSYWIALTVGASLG